MARFEYLLFDLDNTLFDFKAAQEDALVSTFEKYNLQLNDEIKKVYNEINDVLWKKHEQGLIAREELLYLRFRKLFERFEINEDERAFEDEYQRLLGEGKKLIPYAREVIEELKIKHKLYIVTNGVTKTQLNRLKLSDMEKYFDDIFVSETAKSQKPAIEFFEYCFKRIPNIDLNTTIIIGDTLSSDIEGANNANIASCWYNPRKEISDYDVKIDYEISDLRELIDICK